MNLHDILRKRLEENLSSLGQAKEPLWKLRLTEWSAEFEQLMRNRLLMGRFRYGAMGDPAKGGYDCISSAIKRLEEYKRTGNLELLVDSANLCLVEFVHTRHPEAHWESTDDGEHVEKVK
jgi:hypothetical protein